LEQEIAGRGWSDKFVITGWVGNERRNELLRAAHFICAFFSHRSSSGSIASALGMKKIIFATDIPLTRELSAESNVICLVDGTAAGIASQIVEMAKDAAQRDRILSAIKAWLPEHTVERVAEKAAQFYAEIVTDGAPARRVVACCRKVIDR
jgi:hypothetical protein